MSAESAPIDSAGGDFEKVVIAVMLLSMLALLWYLVYQIPKTWEESQKSISKEWEKSTDRIVSKICEVVGKQDKILSKQEDLENDMQLQFNNYNALAASLQASYAKVQAVTPVFTTLQSATVPTQKAGPKGTQIVLVFLFVGILIPTIYALAKEGELQKLF